MSRREAISQSARFMERLSKIKIPAKRRAGILAVLDQYDTTHIEDPGRNIPLDIFMRYYFLDHKKDFDAAARRQIVQMVYTL